MGMLLLQVISPSLLCHRMIESEMVIVWKGMTGIPHASFDLSLLNIPSQRRRFVPWCATPLFFLRDTAPKSRPINFPPLLSFPPSSTRPDSAKNFSLPFQPHCSRRGPRFDLSSQQKFQQNMKIWCLGFHKMYKRKKSAEGPTLLMLGF